MIKLSNIAQDLILENILLNEVGEGVEPYEIREITNGPDLYIAEFDILSKEGDVMNTMEVRLHMDVRSILPTLINSLCHLPPSGFWLLDISFRDIDKGYGALTGRNQVYKVLSTVVEYVKSILKRNPDIEGITYSGAGDGKGSIQRNKLYSSYLIKQLSKESGKYVSVELERIDYLKALRADIYTCISKYIDA